MAIPRDQSTFIVDRASLELEVERIVAASDAAGMTVRVLGSLGVSMHSPDAAALLPSFERTYADIDLAAYRREAKGLGELLTSMGYLDVRDIYISSEGRRSIFDNPVTNLHLDVFYDRLEFCHVIPLEGRLERDRPTIPLAELLLSKLQIVKINEKDVIDSILLLLDHDLGTGDDDRIDAGRVAGLCAADWGLWRTVTLNLDKVRKLAAGYPQLDPPKRDRVEAQVWALLDGLEAHPKTFGWRARARIGERRQWWTDVDEAR